MGPFAWDKMLLIFLVVLVLFGPKELPKVARTIAKFMNDFKRASSELKETWQRELSNLERETQDIRKDLTAEVDQYTKPDSSYSEGSYHYDSSYDYGSSYGYTDSSSPAATESGSTLADSAAPAAAETAAPAGEQAAEAAVESMPVIAAAQGTVATTPGAPPAAEAPGEPPATS